MREQTGHDFSFYKNVPISRRIERRMGIHQIDNISTYVRFLEENAQEKALLFKELLIRGDEDGYRITKTIREMVIFAPQNLIMDPPFTRMDFVSCRNLLIYLSSELQRRLLPIFHYSLNPDGVLLLGSSETIGEATDYFSPLDDKARLYRRNDLHLETKPVEFPAVFLPGLKTSQQPKASKPAVALHSLGGSIAVAELFPGGCAGQRQGRHSLHQRANGQIPGAGDGQS